MIKPSFEIFLSLANDKWYWRLRAENSEIILKTSFSNGFSDLDDAKSEVEKTIETIKTSGGKANIESFTGENGTDLYFRIVNDDSDNLAVSEAYTSQHGREKGINSVRSNAPVAKIEVLPDPE